MPQIILTDEEKSKFIEMYQRGLSGIAIAFALGYLSYCSNPTQWRKNVAKRLNLPSLPILTSALDGDMRRQIEAEIDKRTVRITELNEILRTLGDERSECIHILITLRRSLSSHDGIRGGLPKELRLAGLRGTIRGNPQ